MPTGHHLGSNAREKLGRYHPQFGRHEPVSGQALGIGGVFSGQHAGSIGNPDEGSGSRKALRRGQGRRGGQHWLTPASAQKSAPAHSDWTSPMHPMQSNRCGMPCRLGAIIHAWDRSALNTSGHFARLPRGLRTRSGGHGHRPRFRTATAIRAGPRPVRRPER